MKKENKKTQDMEISETYQIVTKKEISNFLRELKTKNRKTEREEFIHRNQDIILNMDEKESIEYDKVKESFEKERSILPEEWNRLKKEEEKYQAIQEAMEEGMTRSEANAYVFGEKRARDTEKKIEELKLKNIDKKIEKAEEEALKKKSIKDIWTNIASQMSYYNEPILEILFYTLMGQVFREFVFYKGNGKKFNLKVHAFIIQDSRSGKNSATDVLQDLANKLGFLKLGIFTGQDSDAALLRHYAKKSEKRYDFTKEIPGKLEEYDFYLFEEGSCLLKSTKYNETITRIFLDILEGKTIGKKLKEYEGNELTTQAKGSLVATSRPESSIRKNLVESGFFQRCICFMRKLDIEMRQRMNEKANLNLTAKNPKKIFEEYDKALVKLANEIITIKKWSIKNYPNIHIENPEEFNIATNNFVQELDSKTNNELGNQVYKNIVNTFVGDYGTFILKMSYINAMISRRTKVKLSDAMESTNLLKTCYKHLVLWLEENIKVAQEDSKKLERIIRLLTMTISQKTKENNKLTLKEAISLISRKMRVSPGRSYQIIGGLSSGELAPFIKKVDKEKLTRRFLEINRFVVNKGIRKGIKEKMEVNENV